MRSAVSRGGVIAATFLVALILSAMPLPAWAVAWRPAWVAMVLIYWCLALPEVVGVGVAWCMGLLLDALLSAPLGQNALGMSVVAFLTVINHQRIRVFPLGQQALIVGLLILLYLALIFLMRTWLGHSPDPVAHWFAAMSSMVLWPWLFIILRDVRRRAQFN
ncbi:MAG: rod shape-determining protein MreD [Chromatiales bacterium]